MFNKTSYYLPPTTIPHWSFTVMLFEKLWTLFKGGTNLKWNYNISLKLITLNLVKLWKFLVKLTRKHCLIYTDRVSRRYTSLTINTRKLNESIYIGKKLRNSFIIISTKISLNFIQDFYQSMSKEIWGMKESLSNY